MVALTSSLNRGLELQDNCGQSQGKKVVFEFFRAVGSL